MNKTKLTNKAAKRTSSHLSGWLFSLVGWPSPETTEWFCLRSALWWVIQLTPALHLFTVSATFSGLARYGSEADWQMRLGGLLLGQIVAVLAGRVWMRVTALFAFGAIWAFIAGMFWASSPHAAWLARNTGVGVYAALALDCVIVGLHLSYRGILDWLVLRERKLADAMLADAMLADAMLADAMLADVTLKTVCTK